MRNYSIDIIKVIFALIIAIGHAGIEIVSSDEIVHCFFVLSGYFLVRSYDSGKYNEDSINYIARKFARIFPYYITSLVSYLIILCLQNGANLRSFISQVKNIVPEVLLLQNAGFFVQGGINYPLWQMSVLFIASFILFGIVIFNRKLALTVICPIFTLIGFTYWENLYHSHEVHRWGVEFGFLYVPLIRGFAAMSLGMLLYDMISRIVLWLKKRNIKSIYKFLLLIVSIVYYIENNNSSLALFGFTGILIACLLFDMTIKSKVSLKILKSCEKLSLAIYFNHAILLQIVGRDILSHFTHKIVAILIYCIVLLIFSTIYLFIVDQFTYALKKNEKYKMI